MKTAAMVATAKGEPEVLKLRDIELPWPGGGGDVLVRLAAASINPADCFFRQLGGYIDGPQPLVLGHDGAGMVEAVGASVKTVKPGDRVAFCNGGIGGTAGTYAHHAVVPAEQLAKIPDAVSFEIAAALPLVSITAWESLYDRAKLAAKEHALIHAGAGGTGHVAVQLARLRGGRVAATVSSAEKAKIAQSLGAERAINYRNEDFVTAALDWTKGAGIDVAFDNVGAETMQKTYRCMAPYGRVVTLMGMAPDDAETSAYNANLTLINEMMLTPMWKGLKPRLAAQAEIVRQCLKLVAEGKLTLRIAASHRLEDAAKAHAQIEAGGTSGKIVLTIAR